MEKMLTPCMYTCDTDLFTQEEIEDTEPLCNLEIPERIVRAYYESDPDFALETADVFKEPVEEATFEQWYYGVYTAESMTGLYWFARENGYHPTRD